MAYRDKGGLLITQCSEKMQIVILPEDSAKVALMEVLKKNMYQVGRSFVNRSGGCCFLHELGASGGSF